MEVVAEGGGRGCDESAPAGARACACVASRAAAAGEDLGDGVYLACEAECGDVLGLEVGGDDAGAVEEAEVGGVPEADVAVLVKVRVPFVAVEVDALEHGEGDDVRLDLAHELGDRPGGCRGDTELAPAVLVGGEDVHELTEVLLGHVRAKAGVVLAIDHDGERAFLRAFGEEGDLADRLGGVDGRPEFWAGEGEASETSAYVGDTFYEQV